MEIQLAIIFSLAYTLYRDMISLAIYHDFCCYRQVFAKANLPILNVLHVTVAEPTVQIVVV